MNGMDIIRNLSILLEKGYKPNKIAEKLNSAQLYECFDQLVEYGLKATKEIGEKICDWPGLLVSEDFIYPDEVKTNYCVLVEDEFYAIHDNTSLPLRIDVGELYYALITIARRADSILKCGFSKETIAEWFSCWLLEGDELMPYDVVEDTIEYNNFIKIMSCKKEYAKNVIRYFFGTEDPGVNMNIEENCSKYYMFVDALKLFIDSGIEKEYLISCISDVCWGSLAVYLYRSSDYCIFDLLDISVQHVVTEDMFGEYEDTSLMAGILSAIIEYYGKEEALKKIAILIKELRAKKH